MAAAASTANAANPYRYMASSLESCLESLQKENKPTFPQFENGTIWCNATWDSFLCWPAIPANTSYSLPCPPIQGLKRDQHVIKHCHESGRWRGRTDNDFNASHGYTNYYPWLAYRRCGPTGRWLRKTPRDDADPNPKKHLNGWTNYNACISDFMRKMILPLSPAALQAAQQIANNARKIEFVGLAMSLMSLIIAITVFTVFKRLRVFRNQMHRQLMIVMLLNVVLRLVLYVDMSHNASHGKQRGMPGSGPEVTSGIHSWGGVCETLYLILEYLKTAAFAFMFIEGFHLHNTVVVQVFQESEPVLWKYAAIGWGVPIIHVAIWFLIVLHKQAYNVDKCLGDYYIQPEYWIMDGVRAAELILNTGFILNVVRVLWTIVKENQIVTEFDHLKKSVKAALMLIPLLGIPNFLQVVPFIPSSDNIYFFAVFTYTASVFFMFQGFMIAVLYCFTNREVINVVKSHWSRYRLRHTSADTLRRGSRAPSIFCQGTGTGGVGGATTVTLHNQMFSSSMTRQSLVAPLKELEEDGGCGGIQRRRVTAPDLIESGGGDDDDDDSEYATTLDATPPLQGTTTRNCLSDRNGVATKFRQVIVSPPDETPTTAATRRSMASGPKTAVIKTLTSSTTLMNNNAVGGGGRGSALVRNASLDIEMKPFIAATSSVAAATAADHRHHNNSHPSAFKFFERFKKSSSSGGDTGSGKSRTYGIVTSNSKR